MRRKWRLWALSSLAAVTALIGAPMLALAQEAGGGGVGIGSGLIALAANLGVGLAAMGGAFGQGRLAASAMESVGRNPNSVGSLFTPMIIGLAFIESLTLYALVIAFFLQAKM